MEFHEKLQELRKKRNMTQEELAEALFVSRTAVSKWESGKGYPSIDSLKEISAFFQISIDDLLSGDALLSIAERDSASRLQHMYNLMSAFTDIAVLVLIILPLYPKAVGEYIYSVNLVEYASADKHYLFIYWIVYTALITAGMARLIFSKFRPDKNLRAISTISIVLNITALVLMGIFREPYATVFLAIILTAKLLMRSPNRF